MRIRTAPSGSTSPERYLRRAMSSMVGRFFAEHFELVPPVVVEMVIERLSADGGSYPLCSILTPELDYIPRGVVPFFRSGEYQFLVFPCNLPCRKFARSN